MWHFQPVKYSTIRNVLIRAMTWIDLERSQTRKATYYMILLKQNVQNRQICRNRKQISDFQGLEEEGNRQWALTDRGPVLGMTAMFWNQIIVITVQHYDYTKNHLILFFNLYLFFWATPCSLWDHNSPTRDRTWALSIQSTKSNHLSSMKFPEISTL